MRAVQGDWEGTAATAATEKTMTHEIWLAIGCGVTAASAVLAVGCLMAFAPPADYSDRTVAVLAVISVAATFVAVTAGVLTNLCW